MRIISDFHDYYDCIMGMSAYDKDDIKYIRKKKELPLRVEIPRIERNWFVYGSRVKYDLIGFCGKVIPCFEITKVLGGCDSSLVKRCYKLEELDQTVKEWWPKDYDHFRSPKKGLHYRLDRWQHHRYSDWEKFIAQCQATTHEKLFEQEKCPIFVVYMNKYASNDSNERLVVVNERLADFGFQRVYDPYQAFQQISMFMGNMAFPNKPIPEVSNEDMIAAKGFDKFSFRKDKS